MKKTLLLSIKPEHAAKIFSGAKTAELRRQRPKIAPGDAVVVYVSSPVKAISGIFEVADVLEATPNKLWPLVRERAGVSREQYDEYYRGAEGVRDPH